MAAGFEIFVLSDTSNPDLYVQETAAFQALREELGERMRVWYRRRTENHGRKAGNVHDFVTRWGGRYDFMIVLDADSVLTPETLVTMVREMVADPQLALLQTVPRLCGGHTLFARLQQFAGAVYGPDRRTRHGRVVRATTATIGGTTRSFACARSHRRRGYRRCRAASRSAA